MERYHLEIERLDDGTFRAVIEDWYHSAGYGDSPSEALEKCAQNAAIWLDTEDS